MITIKITRTDVKVWKETENLVTKKVASGKLIPGRYGNDPQEMAYDTEYAPGEVTKSSTSSVTLLEQQVEDEEFDLKQVIAAINGLSVVRG